MPNVTCKLVAYGLPDLSNFFFVADIKKNPAFSFFFSFFFFFLRKLGKFQLFFFFEEIVYVYMYISVGLISLYASYIRQKKNIRSVWC